MYWYLAAIAGLLVLSAIFSGSEAALFSLSAAGRDALRQRRPGLARRVDRLLADPNRLLGTLLLSNLLINTTASAVFTLLALESCRRSGLNPALGLGAGGLLMTGVLIVFGDVTPKLLGSRVPAGFTRASLPLLGPAHLLLRPFVSLLVRIGSRLTL
ncbi:DUF21 domain-containing protein, partial [candidate division WOR-3 bacterium]|nr:DUF21 domain-containing protein [candidate division WOR-3 bacterium]